MHPPMALMWLDSTEVLWEVRGRVVWNRDVKSSTCRDDLYFTTWHRALLVNIRTTGVATCVLLWVSFKLMMKTI